MSVLLRLDIANIRNITSAELVCHPALNLIYGENGSGKTSVLEALYLLSRGRSFRSSNTDTLINRDEDEAVVFARLGNDRRVGISRARKQRPVLKLDGIGQDNWDRVAQLLPLLVLDAGTFGLLEGGPKARRQFLDWGVFHVEPGFISAWRRFRKGLANRNQLLKSQNTDMSLLAAWDQEISQAGEQLHNARLDYFNKFLPVFTECYRTLTEDRAPKLELSYSRGWASDCSLAEALSASIEMDRRYKSTQTGPQRADLILKAEGRLAQEVLSRGQQKMLISALKVTQGRFHSELSDNKSIYLVDDLPAELDAQNRRAVLQSIVSTGGQIFVTCVEKESLQESLPKEEEMSAFHVERGKIEAMN